MLRLLLLTVALYPACALAAELERKPYPAVEGDTASRLIGRIAVAGSEGHCTGELIGPDLVLTAAHCVMKLRILGRARHTFELPLADGKTATVPALLKFQATDPYKDMLFVVWDWAIFKIDKPLGDAVGWFALSREFDPLQFAADDPGAEGWRESVDRLNNGYVRALHAGDVSIAGYGADFLDERTVAHGCSITSSETTPNMAGPWESLEHDCPSAPGDSGGPMWLTKTSAERHPLLLGISSQGRYDRRGGSAPSANFILDVLWREKKFPGAFSPLKRRTPRSLIKDSVARSQMEQLREGARGW